MVLSTVQGQDVTDNMCRHVNLTTYHDNGNLLKESPLWLKASVENPLSDSMTFLSLSE
jgi:hypothetical protein